MPVQETGTFFIDNDTSTEGWHFYFLVYEFAKYDVLWHTKCGT